MNNKLAIIALVLCIGQCCHALKDVRIWVHNHSNTSFRVEGPGQWPMTLLPNQYADYASGTDTKVLVYRWCPKDSPSSLYKAMMNINGNNPYVGAPTLELRAPYGMPQLVDRKSYGESEARLCSQISNGWGFSAQCWRDHDDGDKRFHVYIMALPKACPGSSFPYVNSGCPTDDASLAACNA